MAESDWSGGHKTATEVMSQHYTQLKPNEDPASYLRAETAGLLCAFYLTGERDSASYIFLLGSILSSFLRSTLKVMNIIKIASFIDTCVSSSGSIFLCL